MNNMESHLVSLKKLVEDADSQVNRFTEELKKQKVTAQMLLQPLLLKLTEKEKQVLQDNMELLYQFGFSIEVIAQKEQKTYALLSVPFIIKAPTSTKFFLDIFRKVRASLMYKTSSRNSSAWLRESI